MDRHATPAPANMVEVRVDVVGLDAPQRLTLPIKIGEEGRDLPPVLATSPIGAKKECPSGGSSVIMMETAEDWERDDIALVGALRGDRGLLAESLVRARGVVVGVRHGACEQEDGFKHGRSKVPRPKLSAKEPLTELRVEMASRVTQPPDARTSTEAPRWEGRIHATAAALCEGVGVGNVR